MNLDLQGSTRNRGNYGEKIGRKLWAHLAEPLTAGRMAGCLTPLHACIIETPKCSWVGDVRLSAGREEVMQTSCSPR